MRLIISIAILLLGAGYTQVTDWYPAVDWLQANPMKGYWPLGICLLSLAAILVARLRNPEDPAIVAWMALGLAGCLLLLPLLPAKDQQARVDRAERDELMALREAVRTQVRKAEQEKLDALESQIPEGTRDRFSRYRGQIDALTLGRLRVLDARMQKEVEERSTAYREALEGNATKGPKTWITARSIDVLDQELEAHRTLYAATRSFTDFIEGFEERYTQAIEEAALKPPADRVAIAEMERVLQSWEQSNLYEIRQLDVAVLSAALQALNILHDNWGRWSYSPRDDQLAFEDPDAEQAFFEAIQSLQASVDAVEKLTNPEEKE